MTPRGEWVRQQRLLRRMSQADLARATGVGTRTIGRIERGDAGDNARGLVVLENYFGLGSAEDSATSTQQAPRDEPTTSDVGRLTDPELWNALRRVEAEIERRFFTRRPAGDPPGRSGLKSGHHAPYPEHLLGPKPTIERRQTGE